MFKVVDFGAIWYQLLWKQLFLYVLANKKGYSYWGFGFVGAQNSVQLAEVSVQKKVTMKVERHSQKQWKHFLFNHKVDKNR